MTGAVELVTIGLPVRNGARFLRTALDALLAQTYPNLEFIISDNCSTDATETICREYAARDGRIRYVRNEQDLGAGPNFSRLVGMAQGQFFMWAADHDLWHPDFVARCAEVLRSDESVGLCCPAAEWIDENGQVLGPLESGLETRGLDLVSRYNTTLWGLRAHSYEVYGLHRLSSLRQARIHTGTVASDIVLLSELSCLGAFAHLHERLFFQRRMPGFGDWNRYTANLKLTPRSRAQGARLFGNLLVEGVAAMSRHVRSPSQRLVMAQSFVACVVIKYRHLLPALMSLGAA